MPAADVSSSAPPPHTFEIGLVLAGAVTAGAYTAGVVDFLVQALDAWEDAKRDPAAKVPRHDVRLRVIAGASAGSIVASIGTWMMLRGQRANDPTNALYDAWVTRASILPLLGVNDEADEDGVLPSLLDGTAFDVIGDAAFELEARKKGAVDLGRRRAWLADDLELFVTTASLRGIPYTADYQVGKLKMKTCADHAHFSLKHDRGVLGRATVLPTAAPADEAWDRLVQATLASSAFPLALPARYLRTPTDFYVDRIETDGGRDVPPDWPPSMSRSFGSLYVDGGLFDNTPLELARQTLAGGRRLQNERRPDLARRAVLLVDPFPGIAAGEYTLEHPRVPSVVRDLKDLALAVLYQPRFEPEDLALARDADVASRFMIAPERTMPPTGPLASAPLLAFAGALHRAFREHDFALGRRNCQRFLRRWFALDPGNRLFVGDPLDVEKADWAAEGAAPQPKRVIIPLVGAAAADVPLPHWPKIDADELAYTLREPMRGRVERVVRGLVTGTKGLVLGKLVAGPVTERLLDEITKQLRAADLAP